MTETKKGKSIQQIESEILALGNGVIPGGDDEIETEPEPAEQPAPSGRQISLAAAYNVKLAMFQMAEQHAATQEQTILEQNDLLREKDNEIARQAMIIEKQNTLLAVLLDRLKKVSPDKSPIRADEHDIAIQPPSN